MPLTITSSSTSLTLGDTTFSNESKDRALSHTNPTNSPSPSADRRTRLPPLDTSTPSDPLTDTEPAVDASSTLDDDTRTDDAVSSAPSPAMARICRRVSNPSPPPTVAWTSAPLSSVAPPPIDVRRFPSVSAEMESFANTFNSLVDCTCTPSAIAETIPALCTSTWAPVIWIPPEAVKLADLPDSIIRLSPSVTPTSPTAVTAMSPPVPRSKLSPVTLMPSTVVTLAAPSATKLKSVVAAVIESTALSVRAVVSSSNMFPATKPNLSPTLTAKSSVLRLTDAPAVSCSRLSTSKSTVLADTSTPLEDVSVVVSVPTVTVSPDQASRFSNA